MLESPAIQFCFSRFRGTVQRDPLQWQETQIVQPCKQLDDFLPGFCAQTIRLFLGICGGSWATMHWLSRVIDSRFETLTEVNIRIERARETLAEMQETTWGVELREISGERYVALPVRTPVRSAFTMDERPYLKLSRE